MREKKMCSTLSKIAAVLALVGALAVSATALALTVKKAGDACALSSERIGLIPVGTPDSQLSIFPKICLDWNH
jgi:hypothetical protein